MQTLTISRTGGRSNYTLSPTRNTGELQDKFAKCTGKARKMALRDTRTKGNFPKFKAGMSTADYVKMFEAWGHLAPVEWAQLNDAPCTLYTGADTCETLPAGFETWEDFDAAQSADAAPESTLAAANDDAAPTVPDPEPAAHGEDVAAPVPDLEAISAWSAAVNGAVRRGLDRTPIQNLPNYARMAIERADADSGLRSTAKVSELVRAYAATYGAIAEEWEIASALYICGRRFWDFDAAPDGAPVAAPIETAPAEVAPPHYAIGHPLTTQSDARAPVDGERFRILERSRATYDNLWTCAEVSTARRAADVAQSIIAGWTGGERWAVCADSGAFLYGIGADGKPMSAAPVCAPVDPLPTHSEPAPARPVYASDYLAWMDVENGRAEPDEYQARVIECFGEVKAGGLFYNSDTYPATAALMTARYGYPDWRGDRGQSDGVQDPFGMDCYRANSVIRARAERERERGAAATFTVGQRFARLIFNDGKQRTAAELVTLDPAGFACKLKAKSGRNSVEVTCSAYALSLAVIRAEERGKVLAAKRASARPEPIAPMPAEPAPVPSKSEPLADRIMATIGAREPGSILTAKGYAQALEVSEIDAARECEKLAVSGKLVRFDYSAQGFPPGFALPYLAPGGDPVPPDTQPEPGEREFTIDVAPGPCMRAMRYPNMGGAKALELMRTMAARGLATIATTTANGITEHLDAAEMAAIYGADPAPVPGDTIPADNPRDPAPVVEPYRYARGAVVARCKSPDDFKTRAARLAEHCRMRWVRRAGGYVGTVRQSEKLLRLFAEGRDASVITGELYPVETAEPAPCKHPPARLYAGHAKNAEGVTRPWVACCDCGDVLTGGAEPADLDDDETIPAPLDGLDVAELNDLAEFERAGGIAQPIAPAYRDDAPRATPTPSLRIPAGDPRARIPARFARVYLLQA